MLVACPNCDCCFFFRMINDSALEPTKDMFMKVAIEIFSDGKFNWGRVVALFYFACRLVIKVSENLVLRFKQF